MMTQFETRSDIDFSIINKLAKDSLTKNLNSVDGIKYLVVDQELLKPIDHLIKYSELKQYDVDKVFKCEETLHKSQEDAHIQWIYIVRPNIKHLKMIAKHINEDIKMFSRRSNRYKILFSPKKLYICEFILEQEGVYEYISFGELELDLIQLDTDILSMEYRDFFKNYYLHGDQTWLTTIARSLLTIEGLYGKIPNVHLHGNCAKSVFSLTERLREPSKIHHKDYRYEIGHLILVDRNVDYITPFSSSLSFEGLLDEIYGINAGYIDIPTDSDKPKRCKLSSDDKIFQDIRYLHFADACTYLRTLVRSMQDKKEEQLGQNSRDSNEIGKMKEFVQTELKNLLKNKEAAVLYLNAGDLLLKQKSELDFTTYLGTELNIIVGADYKKSFEYIEELINRKFEINHVLRLMILLSITNQGLSQSEYNQLKTQFLHAYGYDKLILLNKLFKLSLFDLSDTIQKEDSKPNLLKIDLGQKLQQLTRNMKSNNYQYLSKKLNVIPNEIISKNKSSDLSYLYNGSYRPIICKYIEQMLFADKSTQQKIKEFDEITKLFPGDYEHIMRSSSARSNSVDPNAAKTVLIYFLGGCSYTEIAALKLLAKQKGYKFYFATTGFINIKYLISTLEDDESIKKKL